MNIFVLNVIIISSSSSSIISIIIVIIIIIAKTITKFSNLIGYQLPWFQP